MVTKVPYLKGKDPSVRQSSLGGQAFQVQSELENQNFITLAVVTKVQYKTGLLDFRLTRNATASVVTSGDNTGTARIPVDDWGKDLDGNVYGHYRPVHVGDTIAVGFLNGHKGQPIVLGVYPPNGEQYELISPSLNSTGDDTDSYIAETGLAEKHVHHSGQVDYRSGSGAIFKSLNGTSFLVIDDNTATDYSQYYTQYNNIPYATTSKDNNQTPRKETAGNWLLVHEDNPDSLQSDKHLTRFYVNPKGQFDLVWTNNTFEGTSTVLHGEQGGFSLTKYINHKSKSAGLLSPDKKGFEKNPDFNDNAGYVTFDLGKTNSDTISLKSATKKDSKEQATNLEVKPDGVYVNGLNIINSLKNSLPSWINLDGNTIDFSKVKPLNFTGDMIKDKSITAKKLNIDKLSDITPNLGTITSGSFKFNTGIKGEEDDGIDIEGLPSDDPNILTEADKKALQAQLNNLYSRVEIAIDYAKGTGNEYQPLADGEHNLKMLTQDIFLTKGNVRVNRTLIDNEINKLEELLAKYQREWNSALSSIVAETANHSNKIYRGALKPANPKENDIWFQQQDDGTSKIMVYVDGNWDAPANKDIKEVQEQVEALPKNYYQDNTPTGTNYKAGDKWYKPITSSDGTTYYEMYAWDPNTRQWSRMLDTNNNHNYVANSAPADATNGDFWTDSTGKLHQYRNGEWEEVATQGPQGVPGPKGQDGASGKTIYIHYAYANSSDGKQGFSTAYFDNAIYLGIYTDEFEDDSHDYHKYSWSRMRGQDGASAYEIAKANGFNGTKEQWLASLKGDKGDKGTPGQDGVSTYIHYAYANSSDGSQGFSTAYFDNALYIGVYTDTNSKDSTNYDDYEWARLRGVDGSDGSDGASAYEIAKANGFSGTQQQWLASLKGDKGDQGVPGRNGTDGKDGTNGISTYIWVKYATNSSGSNMSDSPAGATYIGIATGKTSANESSVPTDYKWTKIKGEDGVPGTPGKDGKTTYLHIAYAMSKDGSDGFVLQADVDTNRLVQYQYMGTYADYVTSSSRNPKDYTWVMIYDNTKKRNFIGQPTTPYSVGDTWTQAGATYFCKTERLTGAFNPADWQQQQLTLQSLDSTVQEALASSSDNLLEVEDVVYGVANPKYSKDNNLYNFPWHASGEKTKYVLSFKARGFMAVNNLLHQATDLWTKVTSTASQDGTKQDYQQINFFPTIEVVPGNTYTIQFEYRNLVGNIVPVLELWDANEGGRTTNGNKGCAPKNYDPSIKADRPTYTFTVPQDVHYKSVNLAFKTPNTYGSSYEYRHVMFEEGYTAHTYTASYDNNYPTKISVQVTKEDSTVSNITYEKDGNELPVNTKSGYLVLDVDNDWHEYKIHFDYAGGEKDFNTTLGQAGALQLLNSRAEFKDIKLTKGEFTKNYNSDADSITSDTVGNLWSLNTIQRGTLVNGNVNQSSNNSYLTPFIPVVDNDELFISNFDSSQTISNTTIEMYDSNKKLLGSYSPGYSASKKIESASVTYKDMYVHLKGGGANSSVFTVNRDGKNILDNISIFSKNDLDNAYYYFAFIDINTGALKYQTSCRLTGTYQVLTILRNITFENCYVLITTNTAHGAHTWDISNVMPVLYKYGLPSSYTQQDLTGHPALAFIGKTPDAQLGNEYDYAISFSNGAGQVSDVEAVLSNGYISKGLPYNLAKQKLRSNNNNAAYARVGLTLSNTSITDAKIMVTLNKLPLHYSTNTADISKLAVRTDKEYRGVTINENGLTATAGKTQVVVNSSNGFEIKKSGSDIFHVDTNGNLTMQGNITAGDISGVNFTGDNLNLSGTMNVDGSLRAGNGNVIMTRNGLTIRGGSFNMTDKNGNQTTYLLDDGTFITNKGVFTGDIHGHSIYLSGEDASVNFGGKFKLDGSGSGISNTRAELNDTDIKGSTLSVGYDYRTSYTTDILDKKVVKPDKFTYKTGSTWTIAGDTNVNYNRWYESLATTFGFPKDSSVKWSIEIKSFTSNAKLYFIPIAKKGENVTNGTKEIANLKVGLNEGVLNHPGDDTTIGSLSLGFDELNPSSKGNYIIYRNFYMEVNNSSARHTRNDLYNKTNESSLYVDTLGNLTIGNASIIKSGGKKSREALLLSNLATNYPYKVKYNPYFDNSENSNVYDALSGTTSIYANFFGYGDDITANISSLGNEQVNTILYNRIKALSNENYTSKYYDTYMNPATLTRTTENANKNNPMWLYDFDYWHDPYYDEDVTYMGYYGNSDPSIPDSQFSASNIGNNTVLHKRTILNTEYPLLEDPVWRTNSGSSPTGYPRLNKNSKDDSMIKFKAGDDLIAGVMISMDKEDWSSIKGLHDGVYVVSEAGSSSNGRVFPDVGYGIQLAYKYDSSPNTTREVSGGTVTFNQVPKEWGLGLNYLYAIVRFKPTESGHISSVYINSKNNSDKFKISARFFDPFIIHANTNAIRYIGGTDVSISKLGKFNRGYIAETPVYNDSPENVGINRSISTIDYKYAPFVILNLNNVREGDIVNIDVPLNYSDPDKRTGSTINLAFTGMPDSPNSTSSFDFNTVITPKKLDDIKEQPLIPGNYVYSFSFIWKDEYKKQFNVSSNGILIGYYTISNIPIYAKSYLNDFNRGNYSVSIGSPITIVDNNNNNISEYKTYLDDNGSLYQSYHSKFSNHINPNPNKLGNIQFGKNGIPFSVYGNSGWSIAGNDSSSIVYQRSAPWNGLGTQVYLEKGRYTIAASVKVTGSGTANFHTYIHDPVRNDAPVGYTYITAMDINVNGNSNSWEFIHCYFEITEDGIYAPRFETSNAISYQIKELQVTPASLVFNASRNNSYADVISNDLINKSKYGASDLELTTIVHHNVGNDLVNGTTASREGSRAVKMNASKGLRFLGTLNSNASDTPAISFYGSSDYNNIIYRDTNTWWTGYDIRTTKGEYANLGSDNINGLWIDQYGNMHGFPESNTFSISSADNRMIFKSPLNGILGLKKWAFEFHNISTRDDMGDTLNIGAVEFGGGDLNSAGVPGWDWMRGARVPAIYSKYNGGVSGIAFPNHFIVPFAKHNDGSTWGEAFQPWGWTHKEDIFVDLYE